MIATTKHSLKKLETLMKELGYAVRYEKGNFTSGYCLVEQRRIAIVNKFYDTEGRVNVLLDILSGYSVPPEGITLTPASEKLFARVRRLLSRQAASEEE
ncbi:hypothetical protein CLV84_4220 [Neolewinella xylanilytica]|uniref:Uncharacterized protein n=1 Tax=Neolewinella xylanilytica TaxID=1514080 RepID=A0A2S6HZW1_9BACT|nr:hypothetical protein [Neolewinella xylanilytica]PPK84070.1 hypothetical protein CLV84_4220 [Neolewinella xylanilytica]